MRLVAGQVRALRRLGGGLSVERPRTHLHTQFGVLNILSRSGRREAGQALVNFLDDPSSPREITRHRRAVGVNYASLPSLERRPQRLGLGAGLLGFSRVFLTSPRLLIIIVFPAFDFRERRVALVAGLVQSLHRPGAVPPVFQFLDARKRRVALLFGGLESKFEFRPVASLRLDQFGGEGVANGFPVVRTSQK